MVFDVMTYNGEDDLFDLHYNVLKDAVDEFRVIAFDKTFSGKPRAKIFTLDGSKYPKARFFLNTEHQYAKYMEMAYQSPQTQGAEHWKMEFAQKESIRDRLTDLGDEDRVIIGDVDEIIDPEYIKKYGIWQTYKMSLKVYVYFLNNRSSEEFYGPLIGRWGYIKDDIENKSRSLNQLRGMYCWPPVLPYDAKAGWHFTSMGGPEALHVKLTDSYTADSYATPEVLENLSTRYGKQDFLGRNFTYRIDETGWPQYLKDNREKYAHLMSPTISGTGVQ